MNVTTAVIFAAGYGSRMLPVTSAVEKELLPVLNRPVIDYVVADCLAAGIKRVIFVIQPGSHGLQDYYVGNAGLEAALHRHGKTAALEALATIHRQATFEFVEQPASAGYGTAVPLRVAAPHLAADEAFYVSAGDSFSWRDDATSETAALIASLRTDPAAVAAIATLEVPADQLHRYGVLGVRQETGKTYLRELVEKPAPGQAPSSFINTAKYVFTPAVLPYLDRIQPDPTSGEYFLTDAVLAAAADHPVVVHPVAGTYLDAGNVEGWLRANLVLGATDPTLAAIMREIPLK